ncbi:MAG: hypothetical protein IKO05_00915 [Selenomonadaceae bacterium]|nr:hypothetical protein [Selenomonadaceae bacterium]
MATREENLKKINEELEKLDDEQLEKVAGGILLVTMSVSDPKKEPEDIIHVRDSSKRLLML